MNTSEKIKNNKYLVLALLFALLNMGAIFLFFGFRQYSDSLSHLTAIQWFQGKDVGVDWVSIHFWRMLTPLGFLIALPFEFLGEGAGLIVQNAIFYFFSAYLMFRIIELVFHNKEQAFLGVVLFSTSLPILYFGLSYLTDMGGWFFSLLSVYLTLLYLKHKNEKLIIINGLLSGIGVSLKANGGLGILFFIMIILLFREFNFREKFLKILKFGAVFLMPIIILQIFTLIFLHHTLLDGYFSARTISSVQTFREQPGSVYLRLGRFTSIIYAYSGEFLKAFGIAGLFFSLIGLWREWLQKNKERLKIYLALFPLSFSFLIYSPTDSRFAFISTPLLILLATYGLIYLKGIFSRKMGWLVVFVLLTSHVVFNYYFLSVGSYRKIFMKLLGYII